MSQHNSDYSGPIMKPVLHSMQFEINDTQHI